MARALQLAELGMFTTDPNPRVGCVISREAQIVGEGWHQRAGGPHAEIHALRLAGSKAQGATAYVSLEPCCHYGRTPPCTDALINAKVARVVVAMQDPNPKVAGHGLQQLRNAGIAVEVGCLEEQARALNPGFIKRMQAGRPWVRNKMAMSLDGRTAMADGDSKWISSEAARLDVQRLRARSSAILTGVGTILTDDPSLTVRLDSELIQPLRVVMDTYLSTPPKARVLSEPGQTLIVTCSEDPDACELLQSASARVLTLPRKGNNVDLEALLEKLAELEVNEVLLEAGATLSGAMLQAGLIDELVIYMAPLLLGDTARALYRLPLLHTMADRIELQITDVRAVGVDWRISARLKPRQTA
ncbi:MAG: bifunctional diaminohydroxyphosphoribosylaminopyrimidine deaminase/5-amino-6-(5-phosphoribosylamino)uracil reductase RibD [Gammaproteobacteria bacterium]|nr:bifunctional diaminohydroxyphosphoribosylaminopyrimidine deaminase/5-amino-6-(5-phosphoribosylamino)uracil reductase RibD [Gammaproteobacteria bacterium]